MLSGSLSLLCQPSLPGPCALRLRAPVESHQDAVLRAKLHQHAWEPSVEWTGHYGGHYGCHAPGYLRSYVVPLFLPNPGPSYAAAIR